MDTLQHLRRHHSPVLSSVVDALRTRANTGSVEQEPVLMDKKMPEPGVRATRHQRNTIHS